MNPRALLQLLACLMLTVLAVAGCGGGGGVDSKFRGQLGVSSCPRKTPSRDISVRWKPLACQPQEADTLYLLDANRERTLRPGNAGGLISGDQRRLGADPWGNTVIAVPGRFREGMTNMGAPHPGFAWMPAEGVLGADQFTIELWLKSSVAWNQLPNEVPVAVNDAAGTASFKLRVGAGSVTAVLAQAQRSTPTQAAVKGKVTAPAGQWTELAVTLNSGTLRLYVDGSLAASRTGVVSPLQWTDTGYDDGLTLLGMKGKPTVDLTLSDLRVSGRARTPGRQVSLRPSTVAVAANRSTGQTVNQGLRGVLHEVGGGADPALVGPYVTTIRTDKMLSVTPIKAGGPDAAHPSRGFSGRFSYDWQVVDRTMRYIASFHATPYISIDSTPSLLGGSKPAFSGVKLRTALASTLGPGYAPQPPSSFSAYAAMVEDLIHHIVVQDHIPVPAWGVWNEPDGPEFWTGTMSQYMQLYAALAPAVKKADPAARVGGPETATADLPWIAGLMQTAAQQHLPLNFVSFHYYTGSVGSLDADHALVDRLAHHFGLPPVPVIVGEWNWNTRNAPGRGLQPFTALNYYANDWGAAFDASSMIAMQRDGVLYSILTSGRRGITASEQTLATPQVVRAPLNVYRMWAMLGSDVVPSTGELPAGVSLIATRTATSVKILIAYMRYRRDHSEPLTLDVTGTSPQAMVTRYEIDTHHSDSVDAGAAHANLEQVASPGLHDGRLTLTLPPSSVNLIVIPR